MKSICKLIVVSILSCMLSACLGEVSSTSTTSPTPLPDTGPTIDMKSAIYQITDFPSGTLTVTTDTVGSTVYGKYSVIKNGNLVSSGTVEGTTSKLLLNKPQPTSCKEDYVIDPLSVTAAQTEVSITGSD